MRRELREMKAKLAERDKGEAKASPAPAEKAEEKAPPRQEVSDPEPDKTKEYASWLEWQLRQKDKALAEQGSQIKEIRDWRDEQKKQTETEATIKAAVEEFQTLEEGYKTQNVDYMNAVDFARGKYADALRTLNPQMSQQHINHRIDQEILAFASQCAQKGLNPCEELYDMAIERFGYAKRPETAPKAETQQPQRPQKPDLRSISNNKRRSATPLAGGGQGGSIPVTREMAADMSIGEFNRLTPDQLRALEELG